MFCDHQRDSKQTANLPLQTLFRDVIECHGKEIFVMVIPKTFRIRKDMHKCMQLHPHIHAAHTHHIHEAKALATKGSSEEEPAVVQEESGASALTW